MGIMHFWNQGDIVTHSIAVVLAILSLLSWAIIGSRFFVNQRAKLTRQPGISALNFDHPG